MSQALPSNDMIVIRGDSPPPEAEELFARQLADSRSQAAIDTKGKWQFALICAITADRHVLGGVHLGIGPMGGPGPMPDERIAYLERTLVRPEYRRRGLATRLLNRAIEVAREAGCWYIRCSNNWDNPAERSLFIRCGFVLLDNTDEDPGPEPCYQAIRALR